MPVNDFVSSTGRRKNGSRWNGIAANGTTVASALSIRSPQCSRWSSNSRLSTNAPGRHPRRWAYRASAYEPITITSVPSGSVGSGSIVPTKGTTLCVLYDKLRRSSVDSRCS